MIIRQSLIMFESKAHLNVGHVVHNYNQYLQTYEVPNPSSLDRITFSRHFPKNS